LFLGHILSFLFSLLNGQGGKRKRMLEIFSWRRESFHGMS